MNTNTIDIVDKFITDMRLRYAAMRIASMRTTVQRFCQWCHDQKLEYQNVKQSDVEQFLLSKPLQRSTRMTYRKELVHFFEWLKVPVNPASEVTFIPDKRRSLPKVPDQKTLEKVFADLQELKNEHALRDRLIIELAYGSGLRRKELWLLDIQDIDTRNGTIYVMGKGSKPRTVPVTGTALDLLRKYLLKRPIKRSSGPLFINNETGKRLHIGTIGQLVTNITGINPHTLRHACATHLLENGCNLRYIQELLGHSKISTTQIYTHIDKRVLRSTIERTNPRSENKLTIIPGIHVF